MAEKERGAAEREQLQAELVVLTAERNSLRARLSAAEQALHPTTEEGLGALIETLRGQVELDESGYCVLCSMHYTSEEEIADSKRRALAAEARAEPAEQALEAIAELQPRMVATLQHHGVVFDGPLGADPKNFQHVAFSVYTTLCEADSIARAALAGREEG